MWELNISVDTNKSDSLLSIESRLKPIMDTGKGIMMQDARHGRAFLLIACEEDGKDRIKSELNEAVSDVITVDFKEKFLLKNSRLPKINVINYNAFLKALVAFDREWDREMVFNTLEYEDELLLDGFYNFKLKELREKWQEVCDLANHNSGYLEYHETFLELLRFLVQTIDCKEKHITVVKEKDEYSFLDAAGKAVNRAKLKLDKKITDETLLPNLIAVAPKEICLLKCAVPEYIKNLMGCIFTVNSDIGN